MWGDNILRLGTFVAAMLLLRLSGSPAHAANTQPTDAGPSATPPCIACIRIRVGLPRVVRGPAANIADNHFTEVRLPNGSFRGFSANGITYAIDGSQPWAMSGPALPVLRRGAAGAIDSCGQWINHVEPWGNALLAWIHDETACDYRLDQTHKSMSLASSTDDGLTWKSEGQIITGSDAPTPGKNTGEGDCTALNGQDGYFYAYCGRPRDRATLVSRAAVTDPGPGHWHNYFEGAWNEPGLGGNATNLGAKLSTNAALWRTTGQTVILGALPAGPGLYFSSDHITFASLSEPLLAMDRGIWHPRPDPSEVLAYPTLLDAGSGSNQLSNAWALVYTYVQPNEGWDKRYLVFRSIDVSITPNPAGPQIGVLLARWYNAALHDHWSTTAAVPGNYGAYALEQKSGYLMTVADPAQPSVQLEDCVSMQATHPDHFLTEKGVCESHGYQRLRAAGWVYQQVQPNTQALYGCYSARERSHFASTSADCDEAGTMEKRLGYDFIK